MKTLTEKPRTDKKKKLFPIIFGALAFVALVFGIVKYRHSLHYEETDDAQITSDISPIVARVSGYIQEIRIDDNQLVKKGDTLVVLEGQDYRLKVAQAQAAYDNALANVAVIRAGVNTAQANVTTSQASIAAADANIEAAQVDVWQTTQNYNRYANLLKLKSTTQQQFDQVKAAKELAEKQLTALQQQKKVATEQSNAITTQSRASDTHVKVAETAVEMRQADLDLAKLQASYTVITAPVDGVVSQKHAEVGQLIQAGQSLCTIVDQNDLWVVANFKETQLTDMHPGQEVEVSVDAYPDLKLHGKVQSIAAATGASFSLLPPDNATGNFVKVVQRIPVKIVFDQQDSLDRLRAGMNVVAEVELRDKGA